MEEERVLAVAAQAARDTGNRIKEAALSFSSVSVQDKGLRDFVSEFDLWSENYIKQCVADAFPNHLVLGEETSSEIIKNTGCSFKELCDQKTCWIVDPLDGTSNFLNHIPQNVVSIAVANQGKPFCAAVYDPYRDELFTAIAGHGAKLNDRTVKAGTKSTLKESIVCLGSLPRSPVLETMYQTFFRHSDKIRIFGAAALDICWTACGRFDVFCHYHLQHWDIAAGLLIAQESGATAGDFVNLDKEGITIFDHSVLIAAPNVFEEAKKMAYQTTLPNSR